MYGTSDELAKIVGHSRCITAMEMNGVTTQETAD